eukprot:Tamp_06514.p1 GENE.Tamp_06514~~Tamp_06514.p1  ORF type:complete len:383 (+),score=85.36 Tamp_06514:26-1150(+)
MDGDDLRVKAAAHVADAIRSDTAGDRVTAAASYDAAGATLSSLLESGLASDGDRPSLERKIEQYTRRAEQLRTAQLVDALPDVPDGDTHRAGAAEPRPPAEPPAAAPEAAGAAAASAAAASAAGERAAGAAAQPAQSSVSTIKAGFENASAAVARAKELDETYQVSMRLGCAAVATYETAKSLEEDYQLSTKVKEGAVNAYENAKYIEEEYKVSQNVVEGVKTAAQTAKQLEEEYKVSERASAAASSLYQQAVEYERANRIRERMYAAMEEGWEALKDAAAQAAEYEREHQLAQRAQAALLEGQERCEMRRCNYHYYYECRVQGFKVKKAVRCGAVTVVVRVEGLGWRSCRLWGFKVKNDTGAVATAGWYACLV